MSAKPESSFLAAAYLDVASAILLMGTLGIRSTPMALGLYAVTADVKSTSHKETKLQALFDSGLIDDKGNVDRVLADWLRVLGAPDAVASASARIGGRTRYTVVARKDTNHVLALRVGNEIVLQPIISSGRTVDDLVVATLWDALKLPGDAIKDPPPAEMKSVTFTRDMVINRNLGHGSKIPNEFQAAMSRTGLTGQILKELMAPTEDQRCSIMVQQRDGKKIHSSPSAVLVADTQFGRVVSGTRKEGSKLVTTLGDGTYGRFRTAMRDLVAMTPSKDWFSVRETDV